MTRDAALGALSRVLVVPTTRTVRGIPTEVELDTDDGMPLLCALSFDNTTLLGTVRLGERITRLSPARWSAVCSAWREVLDC